MFNFIPKVWVEFEFKPVSFLNTRLGKPLLHAAECAWGLRQDGAGLRHISLVVESPNLQFGFNIFQSFTFSNSS